MDIYDLFFLPNRKGPPYMPSVDGTTICNDVVNDRCGASGTCTSCSTFNEADIAHLKSRGWNAIRLAVVWAGAQPEDKDELDSDFLKRMHAVLDLCDRNQIYVLLDNHGDMTGSQGCGNGAPTWFEKKANPSLIGQPLTTPFPYDLVSAIDVTKTPGYDHCGTNKTMWAEYAGDPNYNLLNQCCQALNSGGNPGGLGYTTRAQATIDFAISPGDGRKDFVRFWSLVAEAVAQHPYAVAMELMNEPMSIKRQLMFDTWRDVATSVNLIIPDMAISVTDVGECAVIPAWVINLIGPGFDIDSATLAWIQQSTTLFYSWHYYSCPASIGDAISAVLDIQKDWNMPSYATEFSDGGCSVWDATRAANISHSYWHYSAYCNTGSYFGNRKVPDDTFGACILGWGDGNSSLNC